jgi:multiple sugar transport system substrate-binding protein
MRRATVSAFALLISAALAGCGHTLNPPLSALVIDGPESDGLKAVAPGTAFRLELEKLPYRDLYDRVHGILFSKDKNGNFRKDKNGNEVCSNDKGGVDLVLLDDPWLPLFLSCLEPLPQGTDVSKFPDNCRTVCTVNREPGMRALPLVGNVQLFFYNQALVGSPPKTWEDLVQVATTIKSANPETAYGYVMRAASGNSIVTDFFPLLWAKGSDLDPSRHPAFSDKPKAVEALKLMIRLGQQSPPGYAGFEAEEVQDHMKLRTAAMGINWLAWVTKMPPTVKAADLPAPNLALLGIWVLAVPANAPHKREALAFLEKLSRKTTWLNKDGTPIAPDSPPARTDLFKGTRFYDHCERLGLARSRPRTTHWRDIEDALGFYLSQAHVGLLTPEEAIDQAEEKIETLERPSGSK